MVEPLEPASEPVKEITLVKLSEVKPEYKQFCTPDLFLAKENCRHCFGRGYVGFARAVGADDNEEETVRKRVGHEQWCRCIMVDMTALAARMDQLREEHLKLHPEDLMTATIQPQPNQPETEGDNAEA